ncbi:MAG: hypothetical protein EHM58_09715 [Ignavibacteriae bacterium]|nr:MAG: hypothetical protein EHM58_09715 [Ignavibacteriota bacterium]
MKYIVECFNDQCLLEACGIVPTYNIDHNYDQGREDVLDKLVAGKNLIGLIDYDKGITHKYFDICHYKSRISNEIDIYIDEERSNHLVVFKRKLESMIVCETVKTSSLSTAYKLGFKKNTEKEYHDIKANQKKLNNLKNLFQTLILRSPELQNLKYFLINN